MASLHTERSGAASPIFGRKYPFPLDGKCLLLEIATAFADEFNQAAKLKRIQLHGEQGPSWEDLKVTSAYPTFRQHCPRIAVIRRSSSPRSAGVGNEIAVQRINGTEFRIIKGQTVTDVVDLSICTLNEVMRDDLFIWFQQYVIDAIAWVLPQLSSVFDIRCVNATDDQIEYQGTQQHPGFEFYVAQLTFQVGYELLVMRDVDQIKDFFNWQQAYPPALIGKQTLDLGETNAQ